MLQFTRDNINMVVESTAYVRLGLNCERDNQIFGFTCDSTILFSIPAVATAGGKKKV